MELRYLKEFHFYAKNRCGTLQAIEERKSVKPKAKISNEY
jgi:hypothetical protein